MTEAILTRDAPGLSWGRKALAWCVLVYLAILSVSDTIALRNLLLLISVVSMGCFLGIDYARDPRRVQASLRQIPLPFLLWAVFLALFPLWAAEPDVALKNLRGQWLETLLSWGLGFGVVIVLRRHTPSLWLLALASAFPVFLHLALTLLAWVGLLGQDFSQDPSLHALWRTFQSWTAGAFALHWQPFPMGFRGVEPMHGNIGYAACQAVALASVCATTAWRQQDRWALYRAGCLIFACLLSVIIASSRGALLFSVIFLGLASAIYRLRVSRKATAPNLVRISKVSLGLVLLSASIIAALALWTIRTDGRWLSMLDKARLGMTLQNPERILCEGLSAADREAIESQFADKGPDYVRELIVGIEIQDGGRILLMREGWSLVLQHPGGLDGSRQTYEKLIRSACGHQPALYFAHAHQAWINIALALGWGGAFLFAVLFVYFSWSGWTRTDASSAGTAAFALTLISLFWLSRGFFDAVYQDHYLQMQGFIMACLFMYMKDRAYL